MEEYSDRRSKAEIAYLRRGSRFYSRNQSSEERTNHISDKQGCSTRFNPMKVRIGDNQEGARYVRNSFKSSSSKVAPASSSKFPLSKFEERRRQPFVPGFDIAESSRRKVDAKRLEGSKKIAVDNKISDTRQGESDDFTIEQVPYPEAPHFTGRSGVSAHAVESLVQTASLSSRTQRQKHKEVNLGTSGASSSSLTNGSTIPGNSTMGVRPAYGFVSGGQIHGLKNLGCTLVPDAQPSGCPSECDTNRRFDFMRKRAFHQESSSRSRNLSLGRSPPTESDIRSTGHRIRMNEQSLSQQISRRSSRSHQDSAVSVRTRRPSPNATRMSVPDERADGLLSLHDSSTRNVQPAQEHLSLEEVTTESSIRPFFVEFDNNIFSSSRRRCLNTRAERARPSSLFEESPRQILREERNSHRHLTMEGITEVLVALERIEQQAELTYDQLLVLESNLFFGALANYDRHRDMRMDIDNMSYEELLALEERIGSVSTALSDEQFMKCLRRSIYSQVASDVNKSTVDDMKCSICQEEYVEGEEVGRLPCEHRYHVCCIGQWLGQKNWCPVCKASAVPSKG